MNRPNALTVCRSILKLSRAEAILQGRCKDDRQGCDSYEASIAELPVGSMFEHAGSSFLLAKKGILPWSFDGYGAARDFDRQEMVRVLTPRSIVLAFAAGFVPSMHESAEP